MTAAALLGAALVMVALAAPVRSFDPEWLRPRYHYGKQGLLGNYVSAASSPCWPSLPV